MSHVSSVKTKLKGVNADMMKKVLEIIAKKIGANVVSVDSIKDYYGRSVLKSMPKGVNPVAALSGGRLNFGAVVAMNQDGEVGVYGDFWASSVSKEQLASMIETEYTAMAVETALTMQGFNYVHRTETKEKIEITAM